ncbi:MAG: SpoIIE family protein phosphatase, partial [Bacteroidota bacterium]
RSWILNGVSKTAVLLNAHTNIHSLAEEIIPMLCDQVGAIQGAFFNVIDDDEIPAMEMIHSYAYGRKKHLARLFRFGEGLVGQAALEKDIIYRSELPENYVTMTSGILGDRKPGYLVIVPLITNDTVYGALEFAGFDPFSPLIRKFLQQVSENIAGTLLNLRAIHNERMRGQMQALSENSPDLITRFDAVGKIYYVNPVIEEITGAGPDQYLQKNLMDISIDPNIVDQWRAIIRDVIMTGDKQKREMIVPGLEGERVMDVKAIPEYNGSETGSPESVLVVSHDITEMKRIEAEVRDKNKKITQSINYAKRIQNSIILHDELLGNLFPDSFIYYKPKDVVSGDFPWLLQRDDCTYLAAVDCTGHGVPGAMMSLIGYFLLNEIAGHQEVLSPAEMLNRLHQSVRDTLKQDSGRAEARDGMDIALCRIDNDGKTIQFAGAHRPLYQVRHGRLTQYKGDRKAIGGATLRKIQEKPFTNHVIETQPGDAFYLFSDGLPDQLGGPSSMKFSPARVRDLVSVNGTHTMEDIQVNIESAYNDCLGDGKQLDDVLMIGLKIS